MMITPARHKNLYEEISSQIIQTISDGRWKGGERIPGEIELSGMFEVSRNSVRESIKALELIGLLKAKSGSGTFVTEQALAKIGQIKYAAMLEDESSIVEMMEARIIIEPSLARMAAERATESDIARLREILDGSRKAFESKNYDFELGFLFHSSLFQLSGNRILMNMFETMKVQLIAARRNIFMKAVDEKVIRTELAEHNAILDLIAQKKPSDAEALMLKHLKDALARLKKKAK